MQYRYSALLWALLALGLQTSAQASPQLEQELDARLPELNRGYPEEVVTGMSVTAMRRVGTNVEIEYALNRSDASVADMVAEGFEEAVVRKVIRLVDLNEYKRRQAAVGPRITARNFGKDRRYPITSGFGKQNW